MPETTDFDWNAIEDIDFSFGKLPNPADADKHGCLNQAFSQHLYYEETESLFITHKDGTKTLGLNPVTILRELIIDEIFDCLPSKAKTETTKQHIVALLFKFSSMWHIAANGSLGRIRNKATLDAAARQAIANHSPVLSLQMQIPHWGFKKDWWPYDFMTVYDITQHQYGKSNTPLPIYYSFVRPPDTTILTAPIKLVESETHTATHVPSSCVTSSLATTDLLTNKMIHSDVVATPSTTTASIPPVTANLGPLQPVGPIADTPSIQAPHYIWIWTWIWTYSPNSELVSFRRFRSGSVSFQRATYSSPPVQHRDKSPPCEPTNFRWTFNPQSETVVFHRLPKPVPVPLKPSLQLPLPKANHVGIIHASASPTFAKHSAYPSHFCCAISSNPNQTVFCITK
eukprot:jgi/Psemu1/48163/gm1.48163_g